MSEIENTSSGVTTQSLRSLRHGGAPLVLEYKSKKKKKRRTSKGLRDVQDLEAGVSRAVRRATRASAKGANSYEKARRRSARKKRDGAIRDFGPNMGEALSDSLREASEIPAELSRSLDTKSARRQIRRRTREVSRALGGWQR